MTYSSTVLVRSASATVQYSTVLYIQYCTGFLLQYSTVQYHVTVQYCKVMYPGTYSTVRLRCSVPVRKSARAQLR